MYLFYSEADRPLGRKLKGRGESVTEVQVFRTGGTSSVPDEFCRRGVRQALQGHVGMLGDVISGIGGIGGIEIGEHVRPGAIRGHRTFLIAQDLSIKFVDKRVHGCV
jgi:hypothetical protein